MKHTVKKQRTPRRGLNYEFGASSWLLERDWIMQAVVTFFFFFFKNLVFLFDSLPWRGKRKKWWWILPPRRAENKNIWEEGSTTYKLCINNKQRQMSRNPREVKKTPSVTLIIWFDFFLWMSLNLRLCTESAEQNFLCHARCLISITHYQYWRNQLRWFSEH